MLYYKLRLRTAINRDKRWAEIVLEIIKAMLEIWLKFE